MLLVFFVMSDALFMCLMGTVWNQWGWSLCHVVTADRCQVIPCMFWDHVLFRQGEREIEGLRNFVWSYWVGIEMSLSLLDFILISIKSITVLWFIWMVRFLLQLRASCWIKWDEGSASQIRGPSDPWRREETEKPIQQVPIFQRFDWYAIISPFAFRKQKQ